MKRTFLAKLHSPLLGYDGNYELLHFVYDLSLWTDLGGKKNKNLGVPLRVLMAGHTFSKVYWKRVLNGLTDLVKQIGLPSMFFTMSPHEWSAPYHEFMLQEMPGIESTKHTPPRGGAHSLPRTIAPAKSKPRCREAPPRLFIHTGTSYQLLTS